VLRGCNHLAWSICSDRCPALMQSKLQSRTRICVTMSNKRRVHKDGLQVELLLLPLSTLRLRRTSCYARSLISWQQSTLTGSR
jgi:hypothetical protein